MDTGDRCSFGILAPPDGFPCLQNGDLRIGLPRLRADVPGQDGAGSFIAADEPTRRSRKLAL